MESMLISGHTDPGQRRKENQDAFIARQLWSTGKALLAVIDGVGGYAGGEKAASIAKESIEQYMQSPSGDILTMLREALVFANNRIVEERNEDPRTAEMCCVLTTAVADSATQKIYFAHVGDTRLYRFRKGKLQKLTRDHSFVGIREDAGELSEEEAMEHPHRNQILREAGTAFHRLDDPDFMDYGQDDFLPGDIFLLCSDGLTDMVTSQQVTAVLSASSPLPRKTISLVNLANANGGFDNITVVLLQNPAPIPIIKENVPVVVKEIPTAAKNAPSKKSRSYFNALLLSAGLLLLFTLVAGWYLASPQKRIVSLTVPMVPDSSTPNPSGREVHTAVIGPDEITTPDTLHISCTQNFADLKHFTDSTGRSLVLLPIKNSSKHFAAVLINHRSVHPGDTLFISNLHLSGFETGIDVQVPILLQTENLVFENTAYPFRYPFKTNETQASILFINTMK